MANRRRQQYVRTRSLTPPWLRGWDGYSTNRVPFEESYRRPQPYDTWDSGSPERRPRRKRSHGPQNNSHSSYGSWDSISNNHSRGYEEEDMQSRRRPRPTYAVETGYNEECPPLITNPVINDSIQSVVSKLVDMVTKGGSTVLPFDQDTNKSDNKTLSTFAVGDFSTDDVNNTGVQFVGLNPQSLEEEREEIIYGRGLYCTICALGMSDIEQYQKHLLGLKHKKMLKRRGLDDEIGTPSQARVDTGLAIQDNNIKILECVVCGEECHSNCLGPHITKQSHLDIENRWRLLQKTIPRFIDMFVEKGSVPITTSTTDVPYCKICDLNVSSFEELQVHMKGKKHLKMAQKVDEQHKIVYHCKICDIHATSESGLQAHYNGKKHALKVLNIDEIKTSITTVTTSRPVFSCDLCNITFCTDSELKEHYTKDDHFSNIRKKAMEAVANTMIQQQSTTLQTATQPTAITQMSTANTMATMTRLAQQQQQQQQQSNAYTMPVYYQNPYTGIPYPMYFPRAN